MAEFAPDELIDLAVLTPARRLDFLVGEWELLFPYESAEDGTRWTTDQPFGFEIFRWFRPGRILRGRPAGGKATDMRVRFLVEMYASDDAGRTYDNLSGRMLYRRRQ